MGDKQVKTNSGQIHRLDEPESSSPFMCTAIWLRGSPAPPFRGFQSVFTVAIGVIASAAALTLAAAAAETPAEFIRSGANQVLAEMRSAASLDQKEAYFRQLLHQDLDMDGISPLFSAGIGVPRARSNSKSSELFWKNISRSPTAGALAEASGGDFRVTGSRTDPNGVVFVTGELIAVQGARNDVDFQHGIVNRLYRIQDVTIDNVSMVLSYRSEMQSVLASHGGQLGALMTAMRDER